MKYQKAKELQKIPQVHVVNLIKSCLTSELKRVVERWNIVFSKAAVTIECILSDDALKVTYEGPVV